MRLSEGQLQALRTSMYGLCLGSNMWPLVGLRDGDGNEVCPGEDINELLREGLLVAVPLDEPIFVEPGNDEIPDNEMTHKLELTEAGHAAISRSEA